MKVRLALLGALALAVPMLAAAAPRPSAHAYLVENGTSGEILLAYRPNERVAIASITKLMTVLVTLRHAKLDEIVTVAPAAASVGESSIQLRAGEQLTVRDLVKAALIQSANDAATALAAYVGHGSVDAFVQLMNDEAQKLRLRDTHFARPDGLDADGHYSSARDVTRLARIAMRNPIIRGIVDERTDRIEGGRTLHTWNDLLGTFPGLFGVKTGHTSLAGWSEVAAARAEGVTIYATLLGSPSRSERNDALAELLTFGLTRYRTVAVVVPWRAYGYARAPYGRDALRLVAPRKLVRIVRVDRRLGEKVVVPATVALPVAKGQRLGEVRVYVGRKLLARSPLVASRAIARPGAVARSEWYARRTVHHVRSWFS